MFLGDFLDCCSCVCFIRVLDDVSSQIVYEGRANLCYQELRKYYLNVFTIVNDGYTSKLLIHVSNYH